MHFGLEHFNFIPKLARDLLYFRELSNIQAVL